MNLPRRTSAPDHAVFFFDFRDPYAYLVSTRIPRLCAESDIALTEMPIDSLELGHEGGLTGRHASEPLRDYVWRDVEAAAERLGAPFSRPRRFPFDSRLLSKACLLVRDRSGQEAMQAVADSIWHAVWERGEDPESIDTAIRAGKEVAFPAATLEAAAADERLDAMLGRSTRLAQERGVRAVPAVDVEGELFAGFAEMAALERVLRGERSLQGRGRRGGSAGGGGMPDWTFSG